MARTQKVKIAGKFGARYGKRIKDNYTFIMGKYKQKHTCPSCLSHNLKRVSKGIWYCSRCRYKMAGKAFSPE